MRILRVLLIGVIVTSGASRAATGVVSGTVGIEGDGPAVGANVVLLDTRLGAAVRADGSFSIAAVPPGTYKLQARLVGYEQAEQSLVRVSSGDTVFAAPAYPLEEVFDPTGAGDTFAGGFMGYLANTGDLSEEGIRQALVFGSVMASFNVEDFSLERMKRLEYREIEARYRSFKTLTSFRDIAPL